MDSGLINLIIYHTQLKQLKTRKEIKHGLKYILKKKSKIS